MTSVNAPLDRQAVMCSLRTALDLADEHDGYVTEGWVLSVLGLQARKDENGCPCFSSCQIRRLLALLEGPVCQGPVPISPGVEGCRCCGADYDTHAAYDPDNDVELLTRYCPRCGARVVRG